MRKEGYEKSSKIETLNDKISELLQSNQLIILWFSDQIETLNNKISDLLQSNQQ